MVCKDDCIYSKKLGIFAKKKLNDQIAIAWPIYKTFEFFFHLGPHNVEFAYAFDTTDLRLFIYNPNWNRQLRGPQGIGLKCVNGGHPISNISQIKNTPHHLRGRGRLKKVVDS